MAVLTVPVLKTHRPAKLTWNGGSARTHEPGEHLPDLDLRGPGDHDRIERSECAQLLLVLGLHDAKAPRPRRVQHRAEDDHLSRVDVRLPVRGVATHDLPLLVCHVEGE